MLSRLRAISTWAVGASNVGFALMLSDDNAEAIVPSLRPIALKSFDVTAVGRLRFLADQTKRQSKRGYARLDIKTLRLPRNNVVSRNRVGVRHGYSLQSSNPLVTVARFLRSLRRPDETGHD